MAIESKPEYGSNTDAAPGAAPVSSARPGDAPNPATHAVPEGHLDARQDPETVRKFPRRTAFLVAVLIPACCLSTYLTFAKSPAVWMQQTAAKVIPATIITTNPPRTWHSITVKMPLVDMQILGTHDILLRQYSDGRGPPVTLCVVFSEDNRKGTHPPDVCLSGAGSHINFEDYRTIRLANGKKLGVRELIASHDNVNRYFAYYFKYANSFTPNFYWEQIMLIWDGLVHHNPSGALLRYDVRMRNSRALAPARRRVDALIRATFPYIQKNLNPPQKATYAAPKKAR